MSSNNTGFKEIVTKAPGSSASVEFDNLPGELKITRVYVDQVTGKVIVVFNDTPTT